MANRLADLEDISTFGADGSIGLRIDTRITGVRVVLEHVARRWMTAPGAHPADPTMTLDLKRFINHDPTDSELRRLPQQLEYQASRVDFVKRCRAPVTFVAGTLSVYGQVDIIGSGSYPLTVTIREARLTAGFGAVQ